MSKLESIKNENSNANIHPNEEKNASKAESTKPLVNDAKQEPNQAEKNPKPNQQASPPFPRISHDYVLTRRFTHLNRFVEQYEKLDKLGEGTFGQVFMAKCKRTGALVAIKKVKMDREKEGFPITAIREITILKALAHENIVKLLEIVTSTNSNNFFLVFEYVRHDLAGLIDAKQIFSESQIKSLMSQLLSALFQCHTSRVLHRDLKASNLLIAEDGTLKLADFGLSRFDQANGKHDYTNKVVTRWYRAPELFLGATEYSSAIDMWSVGCILGELLLRQPILPGKTEIEQLDRIFELCGSPDTSWPDAKKLKDWATMAPTKTYKRRIAEMFKHCPKGAVQLLDQLLTLDPSKRPSAKECLDNQWLWDDPLPKKPDSLPLYSCNEFSAKERRRKKASAASSAVSSGAQSVAPPSRQHPQHPQHQVPLPLPHPMDHYRKHQSHQPPPPHYPPPHYPQQSYPYRNLRVGAPAPPPAHYSNGERHHQHHYSNNGHQHQYHSRSSYPPVPAPGQAYYHQRGDSSSSAHGAPLGGQHNGGSGFVRDHHHYRQQGAARDGSYKHSRDREQEPYPAMKRSRSTGSSAPPPPSSAQMVAPSKHLPYGEEEDERAQQHQPK